MASVSGTPERRKADRFLIDCAMTVALRERGKMQEVEAGYLRDIGAYGARFYANQPFKVGARVTLHVNFPSPRKGITTIRFEGVVTRSQPRQETAVEFDRPGKFLKRRFEVLRVPVVGKSGS